MHADISIIFLGHKSILKYKANSFDSSVYLFMAAAMSLNVLQLVPFTPE